MDRLTDLAGAWPLFAMTIGVFVLFTFVDVAIGAVQTRLRDRRIRHRLESGDTLKEAWAAEGWRER